MKNIGHTLKSAITEETILYTSIFVIAVIMYTIAANYPEQDALLPRLASLAIIVCIPFIFLRSFILNYFEQSSIERSILSSKRDEVLEQTGSDTDRSAGLSQSAMVNRVALMLGYVGLGYLIGLLWATPIFILVYTVYTNQSRIAIVAFTIISFLIALVFVYILNLPIDTGILTEGF